MNWKIWLHKTQTFLSPRSNWLNTFTISITDVGLYAENKQDKNSPGLKRQSSQKKCRWSINIWKDDQPPWLLQFSVAVWQTTPKFSDKTTIVLCRQLCRSEIWTDYNGDSLPQLQCLGSQLERLKSWLVTLQLGDGIFWRHVHSYVWELMLV